MNIQSQSDRIDSKVRNFFVPSGAASLLYLLFGTILLLVLNSGTIIKWLGTDYIASAENLKLNLGTLNTGFSDAFSSALGGRLGQIIVWSFVGALSYVALWFLKNLLNSFENDIIIDHYLHPAGYNRAGYWGSAMAGKIFFGAMVIILIAYTFLALKVILPAAAALTASAAYHFNLPRSVLYMALCVFIAAAAIYFWILILRLVNRLWKML